MLVLPIKVFRLSLVPLFQILKVAPLKSTKVRKEQLPKVQYLINQANIRLEQRQFSIIPF